MIYQIQFNGQVEAETAIAAQLILQQKGVTITSISCREIQVRPARPIAPTPQK